MEDKKNNELRSRREFFKKAAKGALPILSAIVLANLPVLANETETPMDCSGSCSWGCGRVCSTGCSNSCSGTCSGGCKGSCLSSCSGTCAYSSSGLW